MKRLLALVLLMLAITTIAPAIAQDAPTAVTLIDDFDTGYEDIEITSRWWTYSDDTGSVFVAGLNGDGAFNGTAALELDFEVAQAGFAGIGVDFSFPRNWEEGDGIVMQMRASAPNLPLNLVLHIEDDTQTSNLSPGVTPFGCELLTPEGSESGWVTVVVGWECFQRLYWVGEEGMTEFVPKPISSFEVAFNGLAEGEGTLSGSIWLDDIRVISETDLNAPPSFDEVFGELPVIRLNQLGYRPEDPKYFVSSVPATIYRIIDDATGEEVYVNTLTALGFDDDVQQSIFRGHFNSLSEPGTYRIVLNTGDESEPFVIQDNAYAEAMRLGARFFYFQRSGIPIEDADTSIQLEAGHTAPVTLWGEPEGTQYDVTGGWYDAGDFGRYIPTGAFAVNQLLYAFNANPDIFADGTLDIPESSNGFPDLLDEIRWELDWMLKMQAADGAVHHKVTTRSFPGFGAIPAEDTAPMFLFGVSSGDTAYFAAAMAQASVIYRPYDAEYADQLLAAAIAAGEWLAQNPTQFPEGGFQNPPVSEYPMQGGYDFVGVEDVPRMWAAAELFKATGDTAYQDTFEVHFNNVTPGANHSMNWANAYPMALYAYLTAENADPELRAAVEAVFQMQAEAIFDVTYSTGYRVALTDSQDGFHFEWGSNQVALSHGLYLMLAYELYPENRLYPQAALGQIHYLFGVNPVAKSYISGLGSNPVLEPHHNLSYHLQMAVPGIITEGSNSQNTGGDAALQGLWDIGVPVAMRYTDDWDSWASNEPTIDANATFVALLAYWVTP